MLKKRVISGMFNKTNIHDASADTKYFSKLGFALSAAIHAVLVFTGVAFIGHATSLPAKPFTIVLDGQPLFVAASYNVHKTQEPLSRAAAVRSKTTDVAKAAPIETAPKTRHSAESAASHLAAFHVASDVAVEAESSRSVDVFLPAAGAPVPATPAGSNEPVADNVRPSHGTMQSAYMKEHFNFIREIIMKRLDYPTAARKMGWKGQLIVSFVICKGGQVENIRIVKSSGFKILDDNAVKTIKEVQPFPRPPVRAEIVIPIEYRFG